MKNVTKIKHAGMLRVFVVAALVLLFAAAGVGAVSAAGGAGEAPGTWDIADGPALKSALQNISDATEKGTYTLRLTGTRYQVDDCFALIQDNKDTTKPNVKTVIIDGLNAAVLKNQFLVSGSSTNSDDELIIKGLTIDASELICGYYFDDATAIQKGTDNIPFYVCSFGNRNAPDKVTKCRYAHNICLESCTIRGSNSDNNIETPGEYLTSGVGAYQPFNLEIKNCEFIHTHIAVGVKSGTDLSVVGCTISDNDGGAINREGGEGKFVVNGNTASQNDYFVRFNVDVKPTFVTITGNHVTRVTKSEGKKEQSGGVIVFRGGKHGSTEITGNVFIVPDAVFLIDTTKTSTFGTSGIFDACGNYWQVGSEKGIYPLDEKYAGAIDSDLDGKYILNTYYKDYEIVDGNIVLKDLVDPNAVAKIDNAYYTTLAAAASAAQDGNTIELLKDIENTGSVSLPAGVTLFGGADKHTISGDSSVKIDTAGGTVEDVKFKNIHNAGGQLTAIYAKDAFSGTVTITGCSFDNCDWEAIQIVPLEGAIIGITGNTFDISDDTKTATRYVHIEPNSVNHPTITVTVTGNKFLNSSRLEMTGLELYYFKDDSTIDVARNYIAEPMACDIGSGTNWSGEPWRAFPLVKEDMKTEFIPAVSIAPAGKDCFIYFDLEDAIKHAETLPDVKAGVISLWNNVKLTENIALPYPIVTSKKVTLDLNGMTISPATGFNADTTNKGYDYLIGVKRGGDLTICDSTAEKEGTVTVGDSNVMSAIKMTLLGEDATGTLAKLTIKDGKFIGNNYGICGDGNRHDTEIVINGGEISGKAADYNLGIYHPQEGILTITKGTIRGYNSAIEMRAGKLGVTGGNFEATATEFKAEPNGSGHTITGAAIAVSQHTTNKPLGFSAISGGTFKGKYAVYETDLQDASSEDITVKLLDGNFEGDIYSENNEKFITGGVFSARPDDKYIADYYQIYDNADAVYKYKVDIAEATANGYTYAQAGKLDLRPMLGGKKLDSVTYYYSSSAVDEGAELDTLTSTTLNAGTYYVYGKFILDGKEQSSKRTTFIVMKAGQGMPKVTAAATDGCIKVTVGDGSVVKSYEYQYVEGSLISPSADKWNPASGNEIKITGLKPNQQYTVAVRAIENINYLPSDPSTVTETAPAVFSVTYNANGGTGGITENSVNGKVTLKSTSIVKRDGYTVGEKWNEKPDGTGTWYSAGETVSTGMTLYAQWAAKPYTITFNANGGSGSMSSQRLYYGAVKAEPLAENKFTKDGYSFAGWAVTQEGAGKGAVIYTDKQNVQNLGDITLYAVWVKNEEKHEITATIKNAPKDKIIKVKLMRGNTQIGETISVSGEQSYSFGTHPTGTYNLVAEAFESDGTTVYKTVTRAVLLDGIKNEEIIFPTADVNSKVEVSEKQNTPAVVVGKLDEEAEAKAVNGMKVTITLAVEAKVEAEVAETESTEVKKVQDEISKIKTKVKSEDSKVAENPMQFLEITVKKKVDENAPEPMLKTSKVIELAVPYDFTGKEEVKVYRVHDGKYEPLVLVDKAVSPHEDKTYAVDRDNNLLYIYTQMFSIYSIGFTTKSEPQPDPEPEKPSHSSRDYGASIWLPATAEPTAAPTPAAEPTQAVPTASPVKPTQAPATPAPFLVLLAGLGAAAVLFGLRRR